LGQLLFGLFARARPVATGEHLKVSWIRELKDYRLKWVKHLLIVTALFFAAAMLVSNMTKMKDPLETTTLVVDQSNHAEEPCVIGRTSQVEQPKKTKKATRSDPRTGQLFSHR
jgi:hypothetical protein